MSPGVLGGLLQPPVSPCLLRWLGLRTLESAVWWVPADMRSQKSSPGQKPAFSNMQSQKGQVVSFRSNGGKVGCLHLPQLFAL